MSCACSQRCAPVTQRWSQQFSTRARSCRCPRRLDRRGDRRHRLPWTTRGGTPLLRAVERWRHGDGRASAVRGADPDAACSCTGGENPVWVATAQHDKESLELLLARGADPPASLRRFDPARRRNGSWLRRPRRALALRRRSTLHLPGLRRHPAVFGATGIKAIDLWCPLPQHGLVHLAPGYGLGAIVLLCELSRRAAISRQRVVWTGFVPTTARPRRPAPRRCRERHR